MDTSRFVNKSEMSYHKDGSFLNKILDSSMPEYSNPYGKGERWTATSSIEDFQPILNIAIRRMEIYNKSCPYPILKSKEIAYVCENDDLFEKEGSYGLILYIRNKKFPVNCYTSLKLYSDIIAELNEELDLCIFIQRYHYPAPQPYYSERFKGMITPYHHNSISFCNKEFSKDEIKNTLDKTIFDQTFHRYLSILTGGKFINLSEDKLQLIDQIDILYEENKLKTSIIKPKFIKMALNYLGDKLSEFNKLDQMTKQFLLQIWNMEVEAKIQDNQK